MKKFTDEDEFVVLDRAVAAAAVASVEVVAFKNYQEEWEHEALTSRNAAQLLRLQRKYRHINFKDTDVDDGETRTVIDIEWKNKVTGRHRQPAQFALQTQLVAEDGIELTDDTIEPYYINNFIYPMIQECSDSSPLNSCFDLLGPPAAAALV
jgi:hypothetical protein